MFHSLALIIDKTATITKKISPDVLLMDILERKNFTRFPPKIFSLKIFQLAKWLLGNYLDKSFTQLSGRSFRLYMFQRTLMVFFDHFSTFINFINP